MKYFSFYCVHCAEQMMFELDPTIPSDLDEQDAHCPGCETIIHIIDRSTIEGDGVTVIELN